jgi:hypothetical protein
MAIIRPRLNSGTLTSGSKMPAQARRRRCSVVPMASVLMVLGVGASLALGAFPAAASAQGLSTPQMTITASTSTTVGLQVFANVNLNGTANPTGSVTFKLFGPSDLNCSTTVFVSTVSVSGTSLNSDRFTTTSAGTYRWEATYSGDASNNPVGPTSCSNSSAAVIVGQRDVGLSVTAEAPSGGTIRAAASVGGYSPTGSVTFYLAGTSDTFCSGPAMFHSTVTVTGPGTYVSSAYTPTATGTYKWQAVYSGDQNNMGGAITSCLDQNASVKVATVAGGTPGGDTAVAALSATALSFGSQTFGTSSPAQTVTLSNTGTSGLVVSSVNVTGAQATDFAATGTCTGTTVASGASCSLSISFDPAAAGNSSASLVITDNASPANQSVTLSGQSTTTGSKFTSPMDGQTNVNKDVLTWSPNPAAQGYYIALGTQGGGYDLGYGLVPANQTSYTADALPSATVYAILYTQVNGSWVTSDSIRFTAVHGNTSSVLTYSSTGQTTTFSWPASPGAQNYFFTIGTTSGGYDVVNSGVLPASQMSYSATGLSTGTLFARLYTVANGVWKWQDMSFSR